MSPTLGLITLAAEDWYETLDFYHELLGLELLGSDESNGRARLRAGPDLVLEIVSGGWGAEDPKTPQENPVSLCLRVDDLARTVHELEHRGVWLLSEPAGGLAAIADPEGNRIYLYDTHELPHVPDGWQL
ncbi:MAG: VOC family protein [Chloroflexota bacterium]|nr:VOC family protein [Chloroflexota bacterium]